MRGGAAPPRWSGEPHGAALAQALERGVGEAQDLAAFREAGQWLGTLLDAVDEDDHLLELADLAGLEPIAERLERWIEPAIETDHDGGVELADLGPAGVDLGDVEVDRLLAQDRLDRPSRLRTELGRDRARRRGGDVLDGDQLGARVGGDVAGVHPADAAAAKDGEVEHQSVPDDTVKASRKRARASSSSPEAKASRPIVPR